MHILLVPSWYPTAENPISGIFIQEQALALHQAGHRVGVLVVPHLRSKRDLFRVHRPSSLRPATTVENNAGLITYRADQWGWFPGFLPRGNQWLMVRKGLQMFKRYVTEQGWPDVLHAHCTLYGGYLAAVIKQRRQVPVVLTEHSTAFLRNLILPRQVRTVRYVLAAVDTRLAVSAALAGALQTYSNGCQLEVLGNQVDTDFFAPAQDNPAASPFAFATVALLSAKKGLAVLLDAFALAFKDKQVVLRIGGDGADRQALECQAHELGLAGQVQFLGRLSRTQVRALLQQSHALVSSSYVETFGITLIEAMACGKPVIATRSGGPESFVNETNGLLVPVGDVPALAAGMQKMVQDYGQYNALQIRADCVDRFSAPVIVRRLEEIYAGLIRA